MCHTGHGSHASWSEGEMSNAGQNGTRVVAQSSVQWNSCTNVPPMGELNSAPAPAEKPGRPAPTRTIGPLGGAVASHFSNVSLDVLSLKLPLAPYLLDSGAGTGANSAFSDPIGLLNDNYIFTRPLDRRPHKLTN